MRSYQRIFPPTLVFLFLFSLAALAGAETSMDVYRDGYVTISQTASIDPEIGFAEVELLSSSVENIYVVDEFGIPQYFEQIDSFLMIYYYEEGTLDVTYDTQELTSKSGIYWTLETTLSSETRIILPTGSTILYINQVPIEIDLENNSIVVSTGHIILDYFFGVDEGQEDDISDPTGRSPLFFSIIIIIVIALLIMILSKKRNKKSKPWENDASLDSLELAILNHLWEKGPTFESELRDRYNLPKTSSWRLMRRLQEAGYISIEKRAKVNVISLNTLT